MCVLIKRRLAYVASSTYTHFISTCTLTCYRSTQQHNIEKATTTNLYLHLWTSQVVVILTESVCWKPGALITRQTILSELCFCLCIRCIYSPPTIKLPARPSVSLHASVISTRQAAFVCSRCTRTSRAVGWLPGGINKFHHRIYSVVGGEDMDSGFKATLLSGRGLID